MSGESGDLLQHYSRGGLLEAILAALRAEGKDSGPLRAKQLAAVDQFHTRGLAATRELAEFGAIPAGSRVLDVGCGLGGPARILAEEFGVDVVGLDLVPEFCEVAEALTARCGLEGRVSFRKGSALELPFDDASFDAVWTVQAQMNVLDKRRFYAEIARVLRPGGRFVFQDIARGNGAPLVFPVPWASTPEQSFLAPAEEIRGLLADLGLREVAWRDVSAAIVAWRQEERARREGSAPPASGALGIHLVMGERSAEKQRNTARNLDEGRIVFVQGVFIRPS